MSKGGGTGCTASLIYHKSISNSDCKSMVNKPHHIGTGEDRYRECRDKTTVVNVHKFSLIDENGSIRCPLIHRSFSKYGKNGYVENLLRYALVPS